MRVHEFAKQLTAELGKEVKSSQIIDILSGKKEGLKAQSSICLLYTSDAADE